MALGSAQPLTEMVPGVFPGGTGGRCVRLTTLPPSCAVVMKSGNLNFLEHSGPLQACNGTALPFNISLSSALRTSLQFSSYLPQNTFLSIVNILLVRNARFVRSAKKLKICSPFYSSCYIHISLNLKCLIP